MERVLEKLANLESSFYAKYVRELKYMNASGRMKLAVFGIIRLKTSDIKEFVQRLNPFNVDFFAGQKPYFILEFEHTRALEVFNEFNGKETVIDGLKCTIYTIPLNPSFSPHLPKRPLIDNLAISSAVPGLKYTDNYLSKPHHAEILSILESLNWAETLNRRTVIHFGYRFDYQTSTVSMSTHLPIPNWLSDIIDGIGPNFDQITINRYQPGDGIASHCDTHSSFMDTMYIISLGSDIVMEFKYENQSVDILLKAGSLLEITGDARYGYDHGIKPRKVDVVNGMIQDRGIRYSITIRETRSRVCDCRFKSKCY